MALIEIQSVQGSLRLNFEDVGQGNPLVFIHGWPLSLDMWEYQVNDLVSRGFRCIAYDRRGFGKSDKPGSGYDFDTLSHDLHGFLKAMNLRNVTLIGFSMGGGEVTRYLSLFGSDRVTSAVLISSVTPLLVQTPSNPGGVPYEKFDEIRDGLKKDRPAFLASFGKQFYGQSWITKPVSTDVLDWTRGLALQASPIATLECVRSFSETDFHADLGRIDVPTLVIHGDADQTVPFETTGKVSASLIRRASLSEYKGAPHGLFYTDKERLNEEISSFANTHSKNPSKNQSNVDEIDSPGFIANL